MLDIGGDVGAPGGHHARRRWRASRSRSAPRRRDETPHDITGVGDAHAAHDDHAHDDHAHDDPAHDDPAHDDHAHDDHAHDDHAHDDPAHDDHAHAHGHSHDPTRAWPHVAVVARTAPVGIVHSLVYAQLRQGSYELYVRPNEPVALTADVTGGHVTQVEWPS